jgi:hypothetical protein
MQTFCQWKGCSESYMGDAIMPAGWANFLTAGIDQPLPLSVTLCPEHARALQAQLKEPPEESDPETPAAGGAWK